MLIVKFVLYVKVNPLLSCSLLNHYILPFTDNFETGFA